MPIQVQHSAEKDDDGSPLTTYLNVRITNQKTNTAPIP